jgi:hypothetical protein
MHIFHKNTKQSINYGFIVGTGRCGSTILAQILNNHTQICVPFELQIAFECAHNGNRIREIFTSGDHVHYSANDFINLIKKTCPYHLDQYFNYQSYLHSLNYPQNDVKTFLENFYKEICKSQKKSIFLEQTPWYGQNLPFLKEIFPDMKVIHIIRDGRDVALSFARSPWWSNDPIHNLESWTSEVEEIRLFCKENHDNCIEIRYEDLVCDSKKTVSEATSFLGYKFEKQQLDPSHFIDYMSYFKTKLENTRTSEGFNKWKSNKKNALFSDSLYAWKKKPEIFAQYSNPKTDELLKSYGYTTMATSTLK